MEKWRAKHIVQKAVFAAVGITAVVLLHLLLNHIHPAIFFVAYVLIVAATAGLVAFNPVSGQLYYKLCIALLVFLVALELGYIAWDYSGLSDRIRSVEQLQELIEGVGIWAWVVFFVITLLQVVVLPIPAAVTVIAGALAFGKTASFIISTAGTLVGSVICFFIGRKFGKKVVSWLIGEDKTEKYATLISEKGKVPFIAMMLFPFFPDDILCMTAGLTNMTFKFFIIAITATRPIMLAFYSYFGTGSIIPFNTWWGILSWVGIFVAAVVLMYIANRLIKKYFPKRTSKKTTPDGDEKQ